MFKMRSHRLRYLIFLWLVGLLLFPATSRAWGHRAHRWINRQAFRHLPQEMAGFERWAGIIVAFASEADRRKATDPLESPRHYIDIDRYPEFRQGRLCHHLDSLKAQYGHQLDVYGNGVVPWMIAGVTETLSVAMAAGRWQEAVLRAADVGHYVGDCHQPLHTTENYDGQLTGNDGVHLRYEIHMVDRHLDQFPSESAAAQYQPDPLEYIFGTIPGTWIYVDSIMEADRLARKRSPDFGEAYYRVMWEKTGRLTIERLSQAAHVLGALWYTAWVDAGRPEFPPPADPVPIAGLQSGTETRDLVTVRGVMTIGSRILDGPHGGMYLQDSSGQGVFLSDDDRSSNSSSLFGHKDEVHKKDIARGDLVAVEGMLRRNGAGVEIIGPSITVLESDHSLPEAPRITTGQAREPRWESTLIQIKAKVVFILEEDDGTRLHLNDGSGAVAVFIPTQAGIDASRIREGDVLSVCGVSARLGSREDRAIVAGYADWLMVESPETIDPQDLERLKALGYID
jgi:hypothetical protein